MEAKLAELEECGRITDIMYLFSLHSTVYTDSNKHAGGEAALSSAVHLFKVTSTDNL